MTPYPTIDKCENDSAVQTAGHDCSIASESSMNITCSVSMYFPTIDLHFRHDSIKVETLAIRELNNSDWTKNKSITVTVTALASDDPYVCVASDIPGYGRQEKEAQLFLHLPLSLSTSLSQETVLTTTEGSMTRADTVTSEHISNILQIFD